MFKEPIGRLGRSLGNRARRIRTRTGRQRTPTPPPAGGRLHGGTNSVRDRTFEPLASDINVEGKFVTQ